MIAPAEEVFADAILETRPMLGLGYGAFWTQGDTDPEGLWAYNQITARMGFNLHNTVIEERVSIGYVGLFLLGALTLLAVGCQIFVLAVAPRTEDALWSGLLAYHLSRVTYEVILPSPFAATTVLLTGCLVYALTRVLDLRQTAGQRAPMRAATLAA